jgi:hypothetical protein
MGMFVVWSRAAAHSMWIGRREWSIVLRWLSINVSCAFS